MSFCGFLTSYCKLLSNSKQGSDSAKSSVSLFPADELHISVSEPYPRLLKIASLYLVLNPASFSSKLDFLIWAGIMVY